MKKGAFLIKTIIVAFVFLMAITVYLQVLSNSRKETLYFDQDSHDFGDVLVSESQSFEHIFKLNNYSGKPVKILEIKKSCNCTVLKLPEKPIAHKGSIDLPIKVQLGNKAGRKAVSVLIETDCPEKPSLEIRMEANVITPVEIYPGKFTVGLLLPGQKETRTVKLHYNDPESIPSEIKIHKVADNISVNNQSDLKESIDGDISFDVSITGLDSKKETCNVITFFTGIEEQPKIELTVMAFHQGTVRISPALLVFNNDSAQIQMKSLIVESINSDSKPEFDLDESDLSRHGFQIALAETNQADGGSKYIFNVNYDPLAKTANKLSEFKIGCNEQTFTVPVIYTGGLKNR